MPEGIVRPNAYDGFSHDLIFLVALFGIELFQSLARDIFVAARNGTRGFRGELQPSHQRV